jgi:hypothetical protein
MINGVRLIVFCVPRGLVFSLYEGDPHGPLPCLYIPGCAQHVIQRGNNREACFYDEADYKAYLSFLQQAASKYQVVINAFVLLK